MKKCLLCQEREADKTGSHIVPHFLLKRIDNQIGVKGRDNELGFVIGKLQTKSYFGRNVLPKELEKVYGEVNDELIENNDISFIIDNFFCSTCEKELGKLESEYALSLKKTAKNNTNYTSVENKEIGFVFWISIIWRISILEKSGFKLKPKEENKLRRILKKYLANSKLDNSDQDLKNIGYKLLRSPNYPEDLATFLHCSPFNVRPYSFIIDEYILFFYFKSTYLNAMPSTFYGSEILIKDAEYNTPFTSETILSISDIDLKEIIQNFVNHGASIRMNEYVEILDELHRKLGGKGRMDEKLKQKILNNIASSTEPIGKKDSMENIRKIIITTMKEKILLLI
jgi:hypothetical protein